jgi:hypothetical protein
MATSGGKQTLGWERPQCQQEDRGLLRLGSGELHRPALANGWVVAGVLPNPEIAQPNLAWSALATAPAREWTWSLR